MVRPGRDRLIGDVEVDESPLLSTLRGFNVIEAIRREARDGLCSPLQARADAANEFAFGWLAL